MTSGVDPDAFNAFEAEGWESRAAGYHDFFAGITTRVIEPLLDAAAVAPGTRSLDVASGPGYVAAAAMARGAEATGIDVAAEMVALAEHLHPGARFLEGDAEDLPFPDGCFDCVTANFAILHLGRPERAASEIARVLAAGGRASLTVWDVPESSRLLGAFVDAVATAGASPPSSVPVGPDFFHFADEGEFERLLAGAGLEGAGVQTLAFNHRVGSSGELWDGVLGGSVRTAALIAAQDDATRRRIRDAFDTIVGGYAGNRGLEIPVVVKLASGRRP